MKKVLTTLTLIVAVAFNLLAANKPAKPNIVFILADDYGLESVSCYGSDRFKGRTPNLDALAKSGIRFENGYCTPLCGPTRCLLMTGRYGFRTGGTNNQSAGQPQSKDEPSLARTLKQAGYTTGMAGKWRQMGESPREWGFDEFITDNTAGGWFWQKDYNRNGKIVETDSEVYCPDVYMEFAKDFLKRHRDEPFYFYFPSHLVHNPILRTPDSTPGGDLYRENVAYLDHFLRRQRDGERIRHHRRAADFGAQGHDVRRRRARAVHRKLEGRDARRHSVERSCEFQRPVSHLRGTSRSKTAERREARWRQFRSAVAR
jgi:arylsulfatase A